MTRSSTCCLYFLLGMTVLSLPACKNEINLTIAKNGKVVLNPNKGDVLKWTGVGMGVKFFFPFCKGQDNSKFFMECIVDVDPPKQGLADYSYYCAKGACPDPDVEVGSAVGGPVVVPKIDLLARLQGLNIRMMCTPENKVLISPTDLNNGSYGGDDPVVRGKVVDWAFNGNTSPSWNVKFDGATKVCNEADISSPDHTICTLADGVPGTTYTYKLTTDTCGSATGSVTMTRVQ